MRGRWWIIVLAIAMLMVPFIATADPIAGITLPSLSSKPGIFWSDCGFSHRLPDDPIVAPKKPGASHSHDFFGNRSTNAFSTDATLRAAGTLCHRPLDRAAYWVPTLNQYGKALKPFGIVVYYLPGAKSAESVRAFPAGLRVIAGNGKATSAQPTSIHAWSCSGSSSRSSEPPLCGANQWLRMHITFPDCWNGKHLDVFDHKSHMAYAGNGCPSSHPVGVPKLTLAISYPTMGGPGITLASGSRYTGHADFMNAWDQAELNRLVKTCLNAGKRCGPN